MESRRLLARYAIGLLLLGIFPLTIARSAQAQSASKIETISESRSTSPAKTVTKWLSQSPTIQVTGVKINQTATGVEVVLETAQTATLQPTATTTGTTAISTVPNAVLALPEGKEFRVENPVAGITRVTVTQRDASTIQVNVTGVLLLVVLMLTKLLSMRRGHWHHQKRSCIASMLTTKMRVLLSISSTKQIFRFFRLSAFH